MVVRVITTIGGGNGNDNVEKHKQARNNLVSAFIEEDIRYKKHCT